MKIFLFCFYKSALQAIFSADYKFPDFVEDPRFVCALRSYKIGTSFFGGIQL